MNLELYLEVLVQVRFDIRISTNCVIAQERFILVTKVLLVGAETKYSCTNSEVYQSQASQWLKTKKKRAEAPMVPLHARLSLDLTRSLLEV